ncbi:MAG: hypothetical protein OXF20_01960 [Gammaproteobacteria bacterium]|nr:hypothetical protein [Gammaproteobacteria bacterium]
MPCHIHDLRLAMILSFRTAQHLAINRKRLKRQTEMPDAEPVDQLLQLVGLHLNHRIAKASDRRRDPLPPESSIPEMPTIGLRQLIAPDPYPPCTLGHHSRPPQ